MKVEALRNLSTQICQYFLDFLESDFKKKQAPRRRVILQTESGFKSGLQVSPYQKLHESIVELLTKKISDDLYLDIEPKKFVRTISASLEKVISEQLKQIDKQRISSVVESTIEYVKKTKNEANSKPEQWIENTIEEMRHEVSSQIVRPILALLDDSLSRYSYSQADSLFNSENDLVNLVLGPLNEGMTDVLAKQIGSDATEELKNYLTENFNPDLLIKEFKEYFKSFVATDSFIELRDIENFASTAEGMQVYLYLGTLKFSNTIYPLFYVPIEISSIENKQGYRLRISNHLYANRRAIDFVLQEVATRQQRQWVSPIKERITYINSEDSIVNTLNSYLLRIQQAFGLTDDLAFNGSSIKQQSDTQVTLTNSIHICAFENSDEALLNDYEEMITLAKTDGEGVLSLFEGIVKGVITSNPESISSDVTKEWDEMTITQRVLPETPLPLNEEQIKIIKAIKSEKGKFIVVEGPPGTGKSHTIVAIAADCAFNEKSCLILSDKKEALEVVYDKLSKTMNEVRGNDEFPNPLLKIGTDQQNFRKLVSTQVITQLQTYVTATKSNNDKVLNEKKQKQDLINKNIDQIKTTLGHISIDEIEKCEKLKDRIREQFDQIVVEEIESELSESSLEIHATDELEVGSRRVLNQIIKGQNPKTIVEILKQLEVVKFTNKFKSETTIPEELICRQMTADAIEKISYLLNEFHRTKQPIFGYFFKKRRLLELSEKIQNTFTATKQIEIRRDWRQIEELLNLSRALNVAIMATNSNSIEFDLAFQHIQGELHSETAIKTISLLLSLMEKNETLRNTIEKTCKEEPNSAIEKIIDLLSYAHLYKSVSSKFNNAPIFDYVSHKKDYEKLNTSLMNYRVDTRLTSFAEHSKADAKILAKLIKDKQKFPEQKFDKVKEAFPVIIASIREFGEYMPLSKEMFDVLVIDEASQVSVAQAFPAMLRAKKIVVMGDSKQFSNTKSLNASIEMNEKYRSDLVDTFKKQVSTEAEALQRLSYFDVKKSVLDFAQLCSNYTIMLRKHFRSYQELIGFSSKQFYGGQLQAIKIRSIPVSEVIKFTILENVSFSNNKKNTNIEEAEFILEKLEELLELDDAPSVGIITPFREQQTLISRKVSEHANYEWFRKKLSLKIMTFDSCQGEERNLIFYSMVASPNSDNLNYIFPTTLDHVDELVESKLKIQRLNVGFSRAQETIWFVLSKSIEDFKGGIGQTLRHYHNTLTTKSKINESTDPNSPMEKKVLNWLYSTEFYQNNSDKIEILPQFPIGDYLRQLDPLYKHPSWRVDFLLTVKNQQGVAQIVIEYDGFEYHFKSDNDIDHGNYEKYMTEQDIERQLTLESYGYKFLRINRFNVGRDPVTILSKRLTNLVGQVNQDRKSTDSVLSQMQDQVRSLEQRESKICKHCETVKKIEDFFDKALKNGKGGYGRICMQCKNNK